MLDLRLPLEDHAPLLVLSNPIPVEVNGRLQWAFDWDSGAQLGEGGWTDTWDQEYFSHAPAHLFLGLHLPRLCVNAALPDCACLPPVFR